jgi:hypothetical protein
MRLDTLKKKLDAEFKFSEVYDSLASEETDDISDTGSILLIPNYREQQRPWTTKAYNEWLKGDRTIVLIIPLKKTCRYFKKHVTDVAEIRPIESLYSNNHKIIQPMIIAIYKKRLFGEPNFCVSFT